MAIPRTLKPISKEEAYKTITKHLAKDTGYYEYGTHGDFIYEERGRLYLIRENFNERFEKGAVVQ